MGIEFNSWTCRMQLQLGHKILRGDAKSFLEVFLASSAQKAARNTQNYHELLPELPTKPHTCLSYHPTIPTWMIYVQDVVKCPTLSPQLLTFFGPWNPHVAEIPISVLVGPVGTAAAPLSATQPSASGTRGLGLREKLTKKIPICCAVYVLVSVSIKNSQAFVGSQSEVWNKAIGKTGKTCTVFRGPNEQHHIRGLMCQGHSCGR